MKYKLILLTLLVCICGFWSNAQTKQVSSGGTLTVIISDLRSNAGNVSVALFNQEKGFPKSPEKTSGIIYTPVKEKKSVAVFQNLPAGEYAVSVFHDENNNRKMDSNFLGIPKEGVGASNNAKGHFGPPKYKDAKFIFSGTAQSITIKMVYL